MDTRTHGGTDGAEHGSGSRRRGGCLGVSRASYLLGRVVAAVLAVYVVLSATFLLIAAPNDPNSAAAAWAVAIEGGNASAAMEAYERARGLDRPLVVRYLDFVTGLATLRWGVSPAWGRPVAALVGEHAAVTLAYVLPATLVSTAVGTALGMVVSVHEGTALDRLLSGGAYAGLGVPNFWLAAVMVAALAGVTNGGVEYDASRGILTAGNLSALAVPAVALGTTLLATQLRHVRSETTAYLREGFIKTARAKGVGPGRVVRHAFRNALLPLVSRLSTELLATLSVSVLAIEVAVGVPGLGALTYRAILRRDIPVVVVASLVPVVLGIGGNLLRDLVAVLIDPRVAAGER